VSDDILDKADALMRRRDFVTGPPLVADKPPIDADSEDVPVLTEVVEAAETPLASTAIPSPSTAEDTQTNVAAIQDILAQKIETWIDEQLPQVVIRVMDGVTDQLISQLAQRARDELLPHLEAVLRPPVKKNDDSSEHPE